MKPAFEQKVDAAAAELIRLGFLEEFTDENGIPSWRLTEAGRARAERDAREDELATQTKR